MVSKRKNTLLRIRRTIAFVLVIALTVGLFGIYVDYKMQSVIRSFAMSEIKSILINCTNRAADKVIGELDITYSTLAVLSRNEDGLVNSVEINSVSANSFKARINEAIAKEVAKYKKVSFSVPIGAAFGLYRTHFEQPRFSYTVYVTTTVRSNFVSKFETAGINQVLHQILMTVSLESGLAMPKQNTDMTTLTEFIVAQTVIVGAVPDAFTEVVGVSDEISEDIFDFGSGITN
ncbi:MAG: hypothetical protein J6Q56_03185 [Clostridia bacterium]|nr:hypothetical protein [Clostridia bacterium]